MAGRLLRRLHAADLAGDRSIGAAFTVGPALWTFGSPEPHGFFETAVLDSAAMAGLITVTLQIAYLPPLYAAFNRRENEIALLNSRAGTPSWGPELLARTHYALGSGPSALNTLPEFYSQWERWAADVTESHVTYLPLAWFRSPSHEASWVTGLLAVLDSAALYLVLCPEAAPAVPPGYACAAGSLLRRSSPLHGPHGPGRTHPERRHHPRLRRFLDAVTRLHEVNFPIQREPEAAWPHFAGWRVNYEQAAYAIAEPIDAVPALWSGPRRHQQSRWRRYVQGPAYRFPSTAKQLNDGGIEDPYVIRASAAAVS